MLKRISTLLVVGMTAGLVGCQSSPNTDGSLIHVDEKAAQIKPAAQYYPVPAYHPKATEVQATTILPPGQELAPFKKGHHPATPKVSAEPVADVTLALPMGNAWARLNAALIKTHYQVADKDASMRVVYVLDRSKTKGRLTRNTPMYRIQLVKQGAHAVVKVASSDEAALPVLISNALLRAIAQGL